MEKIVALLLLLVPSLARADGVWIGLELGKVKGARGGVPVLAVMNGSPGEAAKIVAGDEVLALDGKKVAGSGEVIATVRGLPVGQKVQVALAGAGGERTVVVTLAPRPQAKAMQRGQLVGRAAPDFAPQVISGAKVAKLSSLRGQVVLLDFFATWCGPCMDAIPHLEELHEQHAAKGLRVIGISTEAADVVAPATTKLGVKYTVATDGSEEVSARYHVFALPTLVLVDRRGTVRSVSVADVGEVDRVVRELLEEK